MNRRLEIERCMTGVALLDVAITALTEFDGDEYHDLVALDPVGGKDRLRAYSRELSKRAEALAINEVREMAMKGKKDGEG